MNNWDPKLHPRDPNNGEFTENWLGALEARLPGGDEQIYYHGTVEPDLEEIQPGREHGRVVFPHTTDPDFAYANPELAHAYHYAELAWHASSHGRPRVYKVRATGPVEEDPFYDEQGRSRSIMSGDVRSRHRFEVIEEMPAPIWWAEDDEDEDDETDWDSSDDSDPLDQVRDRHPNVEMILSQSDQSVHLSLIRVPGDARGRGSARAAMQDLIEVADREGWTITLTAEPLQGDRATSKARLEAWYRSLGFTHNRGRDRDFEISASMYRRPK